MKPYYQDDYVTIYHGDCREIVPTLNGIVTGELKAVCVTDPPYGMKYCSGWKARKIAGDADTEARDAFLTLWSPRPALVFGRWDCALPDGVRVRLIWDKGDWPGMGDLALPWGPSDEEIYVIGSGFVGRRCGTVLKHNRLTGNTKHPNEKPVALLARLINHCPPCSTILDPFAGSGTTGRAAKDLGRMAVLIEIEERYCEIAAKRMRQEVLPFPR